MHESINKMLGMYHANDYFQNAMAAFTGWQHISLISLHETTHSLIMMNLKSVNLNF